MHYAMAIQFTQGKKAIAQETLQRVNVRFGCPFPHEDNHRELLLHCALYPSFVGMVFAAGYAARISDGKGQKNTDLK